MIDMSGPSTNGIKSINSMLDSFSCPIPSEMLARKYLNNIVEQNHRFIKRRTRSMPRFKSLGSAASTLYGIEVANMICKGQIARGNFLFRQFTELVA